MKLLGSLWLRHHPRAIAYNRERVRSLSLRPPNYPGLAESGGGPFSSGRTRQGEAKAAAFAWLAFEPGLAAEFLHDAAHDGKPQS